jgi:hypothetical protein
MLKLFTWLLGKQSDAQLPLDRDKQNAWITAKHREWQAQWHDLFDADKALTGQAEFDRPAVLPSTLDTDYRLIFGLSHTTPETQKKCFGLFLSGTEMQRRFAAFLAGKSVPMAETEARVRLGDVVELITKIVPHKDVGSFGVTVVDADTEEGNNALQEADDISVLLERGLLEPLDRKGLQEFAARSFLFEPLLAMAQNFVQPENWITSAMSGGLTDDVHSRLYKMWVGGWQVRVGEEGLILGKRAG